MNAKAVTVRQTGLFVGVEHVVDNFLSTSEHHRTAAADDEEENKRKRGIKAAVDGRSYAHGAYHLEIIGTYREIELAAGGTDDLIIAAELLLIIGNKLFKAFMLGFRAGGLSC